MDSRGWILISTLAAFNRIKALTVDIQLVKDVLMLSSIVEVLDNSVRMGGNQWVPFVLPDAHPSAVERQTDSEGSMMQESFAMDGEARADGAVEGPTEAEVDVDVESIGVEGEEDEEDDVVFVMERTTSEDTWAAARRQA